MAGDGIDITAADRPVRAASAVGADQIRHRRTHQVPHGIAGRRFVDPDTAA